MKKILFIVLCLLYMSNVIYSQEVVEGNLYISKQLLGGLGAMKTSGVLNWNDLSNVKAGSGYTLLRGNAKNGPNRSSSYFHTFNFEYNTKRGVGNITQLAIPYGYGASINEGLYFRGRYSNNWTNWVKVISENLNGNVGIGTLKPDEKLTVNGNIKSSHGIELKSNLFGTTDNTKITFSSNIKLSTIEGVDLRPTPTAAFRGGIIFKTRYHTNGEENGLYERMRIDGYGNVGIGTSTPDSKLTVAGKVHAQEVKVTVDAGSVPDYVFAKGYNLMSLKDIENYIENHHHLPDVQSAEELSEEGLHLAEMNLLLLKKIEELTLYTIEQEKRINELESKNEEIILLKEQLKVQQGLINNILRKD